MSRCSQPSMAALPVLLIAACSGGRFETADGSAQQLSAASGVTQDGSLASEPGSAVGTDQQTALAEGALASPEQAGAQPVSSATSAASTLGDLTSMEELADPAASEASEGASTATGPEASGGAAGSDAQGAEALPADDAASGETTGDAGVGGEAAGIDEAAGMDSAAVDAGQAPGADVTDPAEGAPSAELDCSGEAFKGVCWYLGPRGADCSLTCADHGGVDDAAARYIGTSRQGGSLESCQALMDLLGVEEPVTKGERSSAGLGCFFNGNAAVARWLTTPAYDPTDAADAVRRVCGCLE